MSARKVERNYDENMSISEKIVPDLEWWMNNVISCFNPITEDRFKIEIFSNASLTGWGVACGKDRTHGLRNSQGRGEHINLLEFNEVFYGLKCFTEDKRSCEILLRNDNTVALSYVN